MMRAAERTEKSARRAPVVQSELVREGIDDARYLALIERLIADPSTGLRASEAARARAREFLAYLRDCIQLDASGFLPDWKTFPRDPTGPPPLALRQLKPRLAELISSLVR